MNRYTRQLPIIGSEGQELLSASTVLVVGAGGIGSPVLVYLAAAGIGKIIIVDKDKVELSNLQRQIIFNENDIGHLKAEKAGEHLRQINSRTILEIHPTEFNMELSHQLIPVADLVIDGTDNYETRYLINDSCVLNEKPLISCSVLQDIAQLVLFDTRKICYRCLYPKEPPSGMISNCAESGVLGTVTGVAGTLTAHLALNYLLKLKSSGEMVLRIFDAYNLTLDLIPLKANQNCQTCKQKKTLNRWEVDKPDFGLSWDEIDRNDYFLVDIRDIAEREKEKLEDDLFYPIKNNLNSDCFLNHKDKKILIYCAKGHRSRSFALELREKGIDAYYLKDGISKL